MEAYAIISQDEPYWRRLFDSPCLFRSERISELPIKRGEGIMYFVPRSPSALTKLKLQEDIRLIYSLEKIPFDSPISIFYFQGLKTIVPPLGMVEEVIEQFSRVLKGAGIPLFFSIDISFIFARVLDKYLKYRARA